MNAQVAIPRPAKGVAMAEKDRGREEHERYRRIEGEDDDVQGHRFSEDLTGGDDVAGHVQSKDDEEDVAGHVTPPQSKRGSHP